MSLVFEEKLIKEVKQNPLLYDRKCEEYKNPAKKANVWKQIARTVGEPVSDCMSRWKSLRDRYTRTYKKAKNMSLSGSAYQNEPEWRYYRSLSFLSDHLLPPRSSEYTTAMNSSRTSPPLKEERVILESPLFFQFRDEELCSSTIEEQTCNTNTAPDVSQNNSINNNFRNEIKDIIATTMTAIQEFLINANNNVNTNRSNFSKSVDVLLNSLSNDNRAIAEAKILEYLCKCQLEHFKTAEILNVEM